MFKRFICSGADLVLGVLVLVLSAPSRALSKDGAPLSKYQPQISEGFATVLRDADLAAGEEYVMRRCSSCHDHLKEGGHGKGPHLWNTFGRQAGVEYSEAMQVSGHTWDLATLNDYLARTDRAVPGRSINFRGVCKDNQRAELLKFLAFLNDIAPELP